MQCSSGSALSFCFFLLRSMQTCIMGLRLDIDYKDYKMSPDISFKSGAIGTPILFLQHPVFNKIVIKDN